MEKKQITDSRSMWYGNFSNNKNNLLHCGNEKCSKSINLEIDLFYEGDVWGLVFCSLECKEVYDFNEYKYVDENEDW